MTPFLGNKRFSPKFFFSDRSFWTSLGVVDFRAFGSWMSAPKCLFSEKKILVSVKFLSAILGPGMAAPILWTPGKMRPFCRKNHHVHKILVLGGGHPPNFTAGGGFQQGM